jgi:hypothetical protein
MQDWVDTLANLATSIGVIFAGAQLWTSRKQARTAFEDQLTTQYREIMRQLPITALLGSELSESEAEAALPVFFHYFDLCNEQKYLHESDRIDESTWTEWEEGIRENLRRPAFAQAWQLIAARVPDSFDQLRRIAPPSFPPGK